MIGVERIRQIIPHRYPILLVDRVTAVTPGVELIAVKAVSAIEPAYRGAGPYPLSLLLESWAQAAVLLACWENPNPDVVAGKVELAAGFRDIEVDGPVYPGDLLEHRVRIEKGTADAALLAGQSWVGGRRVLAVRQLSVAMRDIGVLAQARKGARS